MKMKIITKVITILLVTFCLSSCAVDNNTGTSNEAVNSTTTTFFDFNKPSMNEEVKNVEQSCKEFMEAYNKLDSYETKSEKLNSALSEFKNKHEKVLLSFDLADEEFSNDIDALEKELSAIELDTNSINEEISVQLSVIKNALEEFKKEYSEVKGNINNG